jgi:hypothetical protein
MTRAQSILKMIETVDPADVEKLQEIERKVFCYLYLTKDVIAVAMPEHPRYTRSRDALKKIRPHGYQFDIEGIRHKYVATISKSPGSKKNIFFSEELLTEELAELHAVIQAVNYERAQK